MYVLECYNTIIKSSIGGIVMGLSIKDSETGKLIAKDIYIEIATKMYKEMINEKKWNKEDILWLTELTEEEFQKEVVAKVKKDNL